MLVKKRYTSQSCCTYRKKTSETPTSEISSSSVQSQFQHEGNTPRLLALVLPSTQTSNKNNDNWGLIWGATGKPVYLDLVSVWPTNRRGVFRLPTTLPTTPTSAPPIHQTQKENLISSTTFVALRSADWQSRPLFWRILCLSQYPCRLKRDEKNKNVRWQRSEPNKTLSNLIKKKVIVKQTRGGSKRETQTVRVAGRGRFWQLEVRRGWTKRYFGNRILRSKFVTTWEHLSFPLSLFPTSFIILFTSWALVFVASLSLNYKKIKIFPSVNLRW